MRKLTYIAFTGLLTALACSRAPETDLDSSTDEVAEGHGYFQLRRDFRKCIFPICSGWWVSRVNQATTRCTGGTYAAECYVAELDLEDAPPGIEAGSVQLAHARMSSKRYGDMGRFGVLRIDAAYSAASEATPSGTFYGIMDNGIRCFTYPCFSLDASKLNSNARVRTLSFVDASTVAISAGFEARVWDALNFGELIAAGTIARVEDEGPAGDGRALTATQLYVPAIPPTPVSAQCSVDAECGSGLYDTFINDPSECYCTACAQPLNAIAAEENAASFERHCANFDRNSCPQVRCSQPRPTVCDANLSCQFAP